MDSIKLAQECIDITPEDLEQYYSSKPVIDKYRIIRFGGTEGPNGRYRGITLLKSLVTTKNEGSFVNDPKSPMRFNSNGLIINFLIKRNRIR